MHVFANVATIRILIGKWMVMSDLTQYHRIRVLPHGICKLTLVVMVRYMCKSRKDVCFENIPLIDIRSVENLRTNVRAAMALTWPRQGHLQDSAYR